MVFFTPIGRAGNFLFKTACAIQYAKKHGLEFTVPSTTNDPKWNPIYLQHLINKNFNPSLETVTVTETKHSYQELTFKEEWRDKNILLDGYFQTEKYFSWCREDILRIFGFPYKYNKDICSIHARYGDYLTIENKHIVINEKYLKHAMNIIYDKTGITKFKVFSDDIKLFIERLGGLYNFEYSTNSNELDDLIEMSWCHSNIGSSSTFSWWSSWLNKNPDKVIVTPKLFFVEGHGGLDQSDILPEQWIKI